MEFYFLEFKICLEILRTPTKYWPQGFKILNSALIIAVVFNSNPFLIEGNNTDSLRM